MPWSIRCWCAAALGDIGLMFPDTDPANFQRDSGERRGRVGLHRGARLEDRQRRLHCLPPTAELLPHRQEIRQRLADLLSIDLECVGLQAKTGEGCRTHRSRGGRLRPLRRPIGNHVNDHRSARRRRAQSLPSTSPTRLCFASHRHSVDDQGTVSACSTRGRSASILFAGWTW